MPELIKPHIGERDRSAPVHLEHQLAIGVTRIKYWFVNGSTSPRESCADVLRSPESCFGNTDPIHFCYGQPVFGVMDALRQLGAALTRVPDRHDELVKVAGTAVETLADHDL